jgi:hypothetical protein
VAVPERHRPRHEVQSPRDAAITLGAPPRRRSRGRLQHRASGLQRRADGEVHSREAPASLGVVEGHAARGGLVVRHPGNAVRIAFGENADDVPGIESGYRRFAPKKLRPHITDVMRTNKNVVFLWTVTPPQEEINAVFGCLKA